MLDRLAVVAGLFLAGVAENVGSPPNKYLYQKLVYKKQSAACPKNPETDFCSL